MVYTAVEGFIFMVRSRVGSNAHWNILDFVLHVQARNRLLHAINYTSDLHDGAIVIMMTENRFVVSLLQPNYPADDGTHEQQRHQTATAFTIVT